MQPQARSRSTSWFRNPFKSKKRKRSKSKSKLSKSDISLPTNFQHVVHVGWSAQNGFDLKKNEVNHLHTLLEKSGITEEQLTDSAFVHELIQNVMDWVKPKKEAIEMPEKCSEEEVIVDGVLSLQNVILQPILDQSPVSTCRTARKSRSPDLLSRISLSEKSLTRRASSANSSFQRYNRYTFPTLEMDDGRRELLESIKRGTTLKHVKSDVKVASSDDIRNNILSRIRQGVELRKSVTAPHDKFNKASRKDSAISLTDVFRRVLEKRNLEVGTSDSTPSECGSTDNGEWVVSTCDLSPTSKKQI